MIEKESGVFRLGVNVLVTTDAQLQGGDTSGRRLVGKAMAVQAVDVELSCVKLVTERDRLAVLSRQIGTAFGIEQSDHDGHETGRDQQGGPHPHRFGHGAPGGKCRVPLHTP